MANIMVLEYLPGKPLHMVEDQLPDEAITDIATDLGRYLALIHQYQFESAGFFGADLSIKTPFNDSSSAIKKYFIEYMENENFRREKFPHFLTKS